MVGIGGGLSCAEAGQAKRITVAHNATKVFQFVAAALIVNRPYSAKPDCRICHSNYRCRG